MTGDAPEPFSEAYYDALEAELEERYQRIRSALPSLENRMPTQEKVDLDSLMFEVRQGIEARREKAKRKKSGRKSDLREQVIISAVDFLLSEGAELRVPRTWWVGDRELSKGDILNGTLGELEKYDERFQGDSTESASKTVRNLLAMDEVQFLVYAKVRELSNS